MHPETARIFAAQRWAELGQQAQVCRHAARQRGPRRRPVASPLPAVSRLWAALRPAARRPPVAQPGRDVALPGVFEAGPEAFGVRTYLTAAEARQLAADWAELLSEFADRVDDPSRRPAGAVPFEVVVLGRQVPDLAGISPGQRGPAD
jgi:hypothetical protein